MQETQVQSLDGEGLLEKEMATHSSILAWKIPWVEELGKLQSMGLQSRSQLSTSLSPTPVFWPGELHGLYSSCSHKESDTTDFHVHIHSQS